MRGLWVEWKPETAPQAIVMNRQGKIGWSFSATLPDHPPSPSHSSGIEGHFTTRQTRSAAAMKRRATENTGYIRPMILSIGRSVAMM